MFGAQRQVCQAPACSLFTGTKETLGDKHHLWRHGGPSLQHCVCVCVCVCEEKLTCISPSQPLSTICHDTECVCVNVSVCKCV